ncbi:MAG TPA: HD domain-containing phosphohydrolase [bacterium]
MNLSVAELNSDVIGKRLGMSLYNAAGKLLLKKGVIIAPTFFSHLQEMGYRSIYLLGGNANRGAVADVISERLLARGSAVLKTIFRQLHRQLGNDIPTVKTELLTLARGLLKSIETGTKKLPRLVTLKRNYDYLYQHSVNVAAYSILVGRKLKYDEGKMLKLCLAALLYDIGMVFVDPEIVNKTSTLGEKEREEVKTHTTVGFHHLVSQCAFEGLVGLAAVQHHERLDGGGYPNNLIAEDIHEYSKIVSLADFFDAWTSDRPHRRMHSVAEAFAVIRKDAGKAFDPRVGEIFMELFEPE